MMLSFASSDDNSVPRPEACGSGGDKRGDCFEPSMFSTASEGGGGDVWVRFFFFFASVVPVPSQICTVYV